MKASVVACASVAFFLCKLAVADQVSVTGGFTSFNGLVGGSNDFTAQTLNGQPMCATTGCQFTADAAVTFASTDSVIFQNGQIGLPPNTRNVIEFTPAAPQDVTGTGPGNSFLLGSLYFENGIWTGNATFDFSLTTHSSDPAFDGKVLSDQLAYFLTPNDFTNNTPAQNADFVYFTGSPALGSGRAYELQDSPLPGGDNTIRFDVYGYIDSLHLDHFANASGGFLDPGVTASPAPEPTSLQLAVVGLLGMGLLKKNRRRNSLSRGGLVSTIRR